MLNSVDNYLYIVYIVVVIVVHIYCIVLWDPIVLPIVFPSWYCYSIVLHLILYHAQTWYGILTAVCDLCFVLSCLVFNVVLLLSWMEYEYEHPFLHHFPFKSFEVLCVRKYQHCLSLTFFGIYKDIVRLCVIFAMSCLCVCPYSFLILDTNIYLSFSLFWSLVCTSICMKLLSFLWIWFKSTLQKA